METAMSVPFAAALADARVALAKSPQRFVQRFAHGSMSVELYAPRGRDDQTPHRQDELYVVTRGSGVFECGDDRTPFSAGDVLFVPAGMEHRFAEFDNDFDCWVIFWGPDGGERQI